MNRFLASLRQRTFPKEFRIPRPVWVSEFQSALEQLVDATQFPVPEGPDADGEVTNLLASVGTGLWRMRNNMIEPETGKIKESMSRVHRHLESVWDALSMKGIDILDNTGEPFDSGRSLVVVAFQPTAGIGREMIIETIRPTIYWNDLQVQQGEVIVGTPETNSNS